jgi:two-component system, NarL family, response regulator YdfI
MSTASSGERIRVLVSATSAVTRARLESFLRGMASLELVGSTAGLTLLLARIQELQLDVILAELERSDLRLIERWRLTGVADSTAPIVALIDQPAPGWVARALRNGIKAILPRNVAPDEILRAIQGAESGLVVLDPEAAQNLIARFGSESPSAREEYVEELTAREIEILRMLSEGLGNKQIASRLTISEHTVKFHISSILSKLGVSSRTEAATVGIRMGLVPL